MKQICFQILGVISVSLLAIAPGGLVGKTDLAEFLVTGSGPRGEAWTFPVPDEKAYPQDF